MATLSSLPPPKAAHADTEVSDATVVNKVELPTNTLQPARLGLWVLGLGFGGFLLWAGLAPLDEGVPTVGMVTLDTKRNTVQHLTGGLIREVAIKEGQFVKKGDPLFVMDNAVSKATHEAVRQRYLMLRATEGRLLAEQAQRTQIDIHPDLQQAAQQDPLIREALQNQRQLAQSRRSALQADLQAIEESIQGQQVLIDSQKSMLASRKERYAFLQEDLKGMRSLASEGYLPKHQLLEMERQGVDTQAAMAELQGSILRGQRAMAEMRQRSLQRREEYMKEVSTLLAEVRAQVQAEQDRQKASSEELARTVIRAPADGQVVGLAAQTLGGVVAPGQRLLDIVPQNETLVLETKVPPHMIDRVHPKLVADVRFSSFANTPQVVVAGTVDSISGDLLTEPQTGMGYYLARVSVTPEGMKELGKRQMQPGMPAEVIIKTGERSFLTYLLRPLLKRMAVSMKEE